MAKNLPHASGRLRREGVRTVTTEVVIQAYEILFDVEG